MIGDVDLVQKWQVTKLEEAAPDRLPRALVRANSDEELIRLWLDAVGAASENTMVAYKAETLRFLAWMKTRSISLDGLVYEDLQDFEEWLRNPPADLIGPRRPIGSPDWRPFASAGLSSTSVERALSVIANLLAGDHGGYALAAGRLKRKGRWPQVEQP